MIKKTLLFASVAVAANAFEFPTLPNLFKPPATGSSPLTSQSLTQKKKDLLDAVSFTNNGKTATPERQAQVLQIVGDIEASTPTPSLSDPEDIKKLDGVWFLQYTSPSVVGDEDQFPNAWKPAVPEEGNSNIETKQVESKGTVSAAGLTVDTSNRVVKQIIDTEKSIVTNDVELDFGRVQVSGPFRQSPNVPNRAIVSFDRADITLNNGVTVRLGFVFAILAAIRGSKDNGWLETTYLGDDMRIGRGNKGTMFVLTRDADAVQP